MKSALAILALCFVTWSAGAQPVYRCGNAYSQTPCPSGGKVVDATDPRTAAQRAEAHRVIADERRLAAEMRRDRLAEQRAATKPAGASSLSGPAPAVPASAAERHHKKKRATTRPLVSTDFVAIDPSSRRRRSRD